MKLFNLLLCLLVVVPCLLAHDVVVVDDEDGSRIVAASGFSNAGIIVGMTDADGRLSGISDSNYPLTVRCLGYEDGICTSDIDTVRLVPVAIELDDVVVTPADRPVMRVLCYIREYSGCANANDTVQLFAEHMADYFLTMHKVKKFKAHNSPRVLGSRLYARSRKHDGRDSIYRPEYSDDTVSWINLLTLPDMKVEESDVVKAGAKTDTVQGKYCVKIIDRKTDNIFVRSIDYLADSKNHTMSPMIFKLLGFTIDFNELYTSWAYRPGESGVYTMADLLYGTMSTKVLGRGKWIKKAFNSDTPVEINGLFEIYPVDVEYLTVEDAKESLANPPAAKLIRSKIALPLPEATRNLVDAVDALNNR